MNIPLKLSALLLLFSVLSISLVADLHHSSSGVGIAKGVVFEDTNRNRLRDEGEPGIAGVLVSNGEAVVKTDENGAYVLPIDDDTILFVIQPKGWEVPVNELNLPQFYYIHKPQGSPQSLEFEGTAPTGPIPESVDFPLYPSKTKGEAFSIFAFGDPQPSSLKDVDYFKRDIVEEARLLEGPVAGVSLGDIVGDDLGLFGPINGVTALMDRPWWHVFGNHDMNLDADEPEMTDETFEAVYGPATYAFQIADVVFIAIDNVLFPNSYTQSTYTGGFTEKQLTFVENLLSHVPQDKLVVTMVHIPLYDEGENNTFVDEHRSAFFKLFKNHTHTLSLSAHTHTQNHHFFDAEHDHWPHMDAPHHHYNVGTTCGSWWGGPKDERGIPSTTMRDGVPNGYAIFNFDGNQYSYDYIVANGDKDEVMSVYVPKAVRKTSGWSNAVMGINVYNGSEQTTVEFRIDVGEWTQVQRGAYFDPKYTWERMQQDHTDDPADGRLLPYPSMSSHQWFARLPKDLDIGEHRIDIKVTDRFGRVFKESASYSIIEE